MAKKARNRRSGRVARQRERLESLQTKVDAGTATDEEIALLEELRAATVEGEVGDEPISDEEAEVVSLATTASGDDKDDDKKPTVGHKSALRRYLGGVRLELRRVTWPTGNEMVKYSFSSILMLLLTGGAVWAIDNGFIAMIIAFSGLRP